LDKEVFYRSSEENNYGSSNFLKVLTVIKCEGKTKPVRAARKIFRANIQEICGFYP